MPGTTCEIPGVGPIPIEAARAYLGDALLTVVLKKGVDVLAIAHHRRTIPTAVRRTLEARDLECVNAAC
jgi:tRNA(Ile)-lysidine synthase TilS/MesJ